MIHSGFIARGLLKIPGDICITGIGAAAHLFHPWAAVVLRHCVASIASVAGSLTVRSVSLLIDWSRFARSSVCVGDRWIAGVLTMAGIMR
jgi:hypothetical protein